MTREEKIDEIVRLRVEMKMNDAENNTSYEAEFASLIRYGSAYLDKLSDADLDDYLAGTRESYTAGDDDGTCPKCHSANTAEMEAEIDGVPINCMICDECGWTRPWPPESEE